MCSPPIPASLSPPPTRSRRAAISAPPSASPEGSPVTMKMNRGRLAATSGHADADHEQPGRVSLAYDPVAVDHQGRTGFDRDPHKPGFGRETNRLRTDRRSVYAGLLARLLDLDQYATRPFTAQSGAAAQQRVGAFDRLHPEHESLLHHHGLADIERANCVGNLDAAVDVGHCIPARLQPAERPLWHR